MLKIFEPEVRNLLKSYGVLDREIIKIKHRELKKAVLKILNDIIKVIEDENYGIIDEFLTLSPAGDSTGSDNSYIDFNNLVSDDDENDLEDIVTILDKFKKLSNES